MRAASPVPVVTVGAGAVAEPLRKPWRRTPAKFGKASALQSMKLPRSSATAMGGRTGVGAATAGGAMTGAIGTSAEGVVSVSVEEGVIVGAGAVDIAAAARKLRRRREERRRRLG